MDDDNDINLTDLEKMEMAKQLSSIDESEMRILFFTATYFVLDGVTLTIRRLESYLRSRGATVKICSTVPDDMPPEQTKDVIIVPGIKIPFANMGQYAFGTGLDESTIKEIEKFNPNVVHFTVPDFVGLDGIRWCQKRNIAYIGTWHSNYVDYLKFYFLEWILSPAFHRYLKGFFQQIPVVYIPTPYMLKRLEDWGYDNDNCTELKEWGRGIDMKLYTPERRSSSFRALKGFSDTDVVLIWVGRIVPEKRPDIWLSVLKRLQAEGMPVKAMIVGNGSFEKTLSQVSNVVMCGWLSGVALAEAYAAADVLVFPSDVETFGNVTLEALASGCPCVVEEKCGSHLVEHGVNGFTCPANDSEAFYQATRRICANSVLRAQMSVKARESAFRFERSKIMQQMVEHYREAYVRHLDPMFIKRRLQSSPAAAGRNFLTLICCNYWFVKTFAEPFLTTSSGIQTLVYGTTDCVQHSQSRLSQLNSLSCAENLHLAGIGTVGIDIDEDEDFSSRYEDEKKGRSPPMSSTTLTVLARILHVAAMAFSYLIIIVFVYAAFTID